MQNRADSSSPASGLRGKLAKSVMDCGEGLPEIWQRTMEQELEQQVVDLEKYHNTADGRVQVWFGLRTIFNNTDELCVRTKELADQYGVGIHMHVAEAKEEKEYTYARWGEGTVKHLERMSEQAGKRNEKRFSLPGIRLPRLRLPHLDGPTWAVLLIGAAALLLLWWGLGTVWSNLSLMLP